MGYLKVIVIRGSVMLGIVPKGQIALLLSFSDTTPIPGKKIVLATSKPLDTAKKILELFGLTEYFDFIGGAVSHQNDQKWQVLNWSLSSVGIDLSDPDSLAKCILVGDRKYDAEGAKICGVDSMGVRYGHGTSEELESSGFTVLADTVADISMQLI